MGALLTLFNIRGVGRGERDSDSVILGVAARHFSLFHGLHLVFRERRKQERTLKRGGGERVVDVREAFYILLSSRTTLQQNKAADASRHGDTAASSDNTYISPAFYVHV